MSAPHRRRRRSSDNTFDPYALNGFGLEVGSRLPFDETRCELRISIGRVNVQPPHQRVAYWATIDCSH